jgi:hypothetical protein
LAPFVIPPASTALTQMSATYTGYPSQVENVSSIEEIFAPNLKLDQVAAHEQKDNRLFVANLSSVKRDYRGFQRHASKILTKFVESALPPEYIPSEADPDSAAKFSKEWQYYSEQASFLRDEIYAFAIVYIFSDGTHSPAFHIPGRPQLENPANIIGTNPYITTDLTNWDSATVDPLDPNIFNVLKDKRWQVYNTFIRQNPLLSEGYMGYYETNEPYPLVEDCDDDPLGYWGVDYFNNPIEPLVTKIRHHRMPS